MLYATATYQPEHFAAGKTALYPETKDERVIDWYTHTYPGDKPGRRINPSITFEQALSAVPMGTGFCSLLGVDDFVLRTRVFVELARRAHVPYSAIDNAYVLRQPIGFRPLWSSCPSKEV